MKPNLIFLIMILIACEQQKPDSVSAGPELPIRGGQSTVNDSDSQQDIIRIALNSKDHKTLVTALKTADYVDVLSNAGPFTVFAPTDEAFSKLPDGIVENLLKPENKDQLQNILEYHVFVGVINEDYIQDKMTLNQVNLDNVTISKKEGKLTVNSAKVLGSVKASNGIVYVVDAVLLPPTKK